MANREKLVPNGYFHVFNRTNNKERLFKDDRDKVFFLRKLRDYITPVCHIYCYCLLYNHFHLLIRIRSKSELLQYVTNKPKRELVARQKNWLARSESERTYGELAVIQFNRLFNSYAKAFNKSWNRSGNLFNRPFKRKAVRDERHLVYLVYYIQANSSKHGGGADFINYPWSSYRIHLSGQSSFLASTELLQWFGGIPAYEKYHQQPPPWDDRNNLLIEH